MFIHILLPDRIPSLLRAAARAFRSLTPCCGAGKCGQPLPPARGSRAPLRVALQSCSASRHMPFALGYAMLAVRASMLPRVMLRLPRARHRVR